jgi:signal transduction histidine kinase
MCLQSVPQKVSLSRSHQLLELACRVVHACRGGLGLMSAAGELVEHIPFGVTEEEAAEMARNSHLGDLVQFVLCQPGPVFLDNLAASHPHLGQPPQMPPLGPFLGLPLHCPGRYRGALYLARSPGKPAFQPGDLPTVEPIRTWLEQGSLYEEAHLLSQLRLLNRVAQAAAGNLDLAFILERALRELDRHFPLHVCAVWLVDDQESGRLTLAATNSIPSSRATNLGLVPGMELAIDQSPFGTCLQDGQGMYIDLVDGNWSRGKSDGYSMPSVAEGLNGALAARGATCFFAAPLRAGDQTVGLLHSISTRPTGFTGEQIQILYLVADLLGPAISNCRLFECLRTTYEELRAAQGQLIRVEKMRALGELASGMAHDFNNSLCGVLGFLELTLLDGELSASGRNYLESARTCALDAAQTVRRVQDFARWRQKEAVFQPVEVNDLVRQIVELTRHKWGSLNRARSSSIVVNVKAEAASQVSGCASELREVLTNLVFNAVDAMPEGGNLTLASWSKGSDVFISVCDSGVGMGEAVQQRLFEPFFTTKGERGNGMGLSVAFGIIQAHQGEITVESAVGRGSTFTIRLPALEGGEKVNGAARQPPKGGEAGADPAPVSQVAPSAGLRILIIEDEESIRNFLDTALRQLGHQPFPAADAAEGLAAFAAEPFDVVVTDLSLPGAAGTDVAQTVARQAPQTPVILLTGWADQLQAEAKPLEGVARILGKPLALQSLMEALDALCPRS